VKRKCLLCFQPIHKNEDFYHWLKGDAWICADCRSRLHSIRATYNLDGLPVHVLYEYNDFLENYLFQYKEGGDVALRDCFFHEDLHYIRKKYKGAVMVLMPSSEEKTQARGYHALREMVSTLPFIKIEPFYKSENRKQSTLSYAQRQTIGEVMHLRDDVSLPQKKLLLVDDVCTSGATLRCAYHLLKEHTSDMEALVLCANPLFMANQRCDRSHLVRVWKTS